MYKKIAPFVGGLCALAITAGLGHFFPSLLHFFEINSEHALLITFFEISLLFILSFAVYYISSLTNLPSFVVAIFFGIAAHPMLGPVIHEHETLSAIVGFGATLILFGGGLETPFTNFKKLFWKIFSLSFPGLLLTAFLFSLAVLSIGKMLGSPVSVMVAILLGAVLASTDPAAIIPVLKRLRFKNRSTKDIIVSESAVTDVTGTLLTVAFLGLITAGLSFNSVGNWYAAIFTPVSGIVLAKQLIFGIIFGVLGFGLLEALMRFKQKHEKEFEVDSAFFLAVPIIIFTIALSLGGSGYLAAFITGLMFNITQHLHETERFFNHVIEAFFKPTIFILLGALVDVKQLIAYAGVGLLAAAVFMFVVRPITVFITLGGFSFFGRKSADRLGIREILFISFVRETGAIPAVLMVTIASMKIGNIEGLIPVGMWVILATLIVEPILTPAVAKKLQVAELVDETVPVTIKPAETVHV